MAQEKILAVRVQLTGITEETRQIEQLNEELKRLDNRSGEVKEAIQKAGIATKAQTEEILKNDQSTRDLNEKKGQLTKTEKLAAKEFTVVAGSMNELRAKTAALRNEANNLNLTTEAGRRKFKDLNGQIEANTKKIRDYDRGISGSSTLVGEYGRGIMNAFTKVGVAVGAAWGVIKGGEKIIMSAQGSSEKWEATIHGIKTGLDDMFKSIATGDFSGFLEGIGQAILAGKEYTEVMHDVTLSQISYSMADIDARSRILDLMRTMKNVELRDIEGKQKRLDAAIEIDKIEEGLSLRKEEIAKRVYDAEKKTVATTSRLSQVELENYMKNYDQLKENIEIGIKYRDVKHAINAASRGEGEASAALVLQLDEEKKVMIANAEARGLNIEELERYSRDVGRLSIEELHAVADKYVAMGEAHNQWFERTKKQNSQLHHLELDIIKEDEAAAKETDESRQKYHEAEIKRIQAEIVAYRELKAFKDKIMREAKAEAMKGAGIKAIVPGGGRTALKAMPEERDTEDERLDMLLADTDLRLKIKQDAWDTEQTALKQSLLNAEITEGDYLKRRAEAYAFYFHSSTLDVINGLNDMLDAMGTFGEGGKAMALANIGVRTAEAIASLVAYSEANPLNAVTFGSAAMFQYLTGLARILSGMGTARKYLISGKPWIGKGKYTGGEIDDDSGVMLTHPTRGGDNMLILAKKGEVVLNERQQAHFSSDAFRGAGVPGFASGGKVGAAGINYLPQGISDVDAFMKKLAGQLNDVEVYVNINEIIDATKKYAKIRSAPL